MSKQTTNVTTETRDLRNQPKGGASSTSGLRVGINPKATVASGPSLKSQGETKTKTTGTNKVIHFIVTFIISMKLRSILFFTEIINKSMYSLKKKYNLYLSINILNHILIYYYATFTYPTCTLSIFKTIKIEISLCSIGPDITLLIKYEPNIFVNIHLYDYPISIKRLLTTNVPSIKQITCFFLYPTRTKCCYPLCIKPVAERSTTHVSSVYPTRTLSTIKLYLGMQIPEIKQGYVKKYIDLPDRNYFLRKCNKPELNSILFQGAKRKGQETEEPKARRRRAAQQDLGMTYAELSKTHTMLEARASIPEIPLDQTDFEHLDCSLIYLHLDLKPTENFGIVKMGLSQGGVWIACKDLDTVDFVTIHVPKLNPPENTEKKHQYKIYGPNNRPYKYFKVRVPERFWSTPDRFVNLIKHFNKKLDYTYLAGDFYKNAHLRVSSGLVDRPKEVEKGYFFVTLEVEENMVPRLVEQNGLIMIGPNALEIVGGGIEQAIEKYEKEKTVQEEDMETAGDDSLNYSA